MKYVKMLFSPIFDSCRHLLGTLAQFRTGPSATQACSRTSGLFLKIKICGSFELKKCLNTPKISFILIFAWYQHILGASAQFGIEVSATQACSRTSGLFFKFKFRVSLSLQSVIIHPRCCLHLILAWYQHILGTSAQFGI